MSQKNEANQTKPIRILNYKGTRVVSILRRFDRVFELIPNFTDTSPTTLTYVAENVHLRFITTPHKALGLEKRVKFVSRNYYYTDVTQKHLEMKNGENQ